jgi:hypothetical protein
VLGDYDDESLAGRLAAEEPDVPARGYAEEERPDRRHLGQIDGTPEDGDSFCRVDDDFDEELT